MIPSLPNENFENSYPLILNILGRSFMLFISDLDFGGEDGETEHYYRIRTAPN